MRFFTTIKQKLRSIIRRRTKLSSEMVIVRSIINKHFREKKDTLGITKAKLKVNKSKIVLLVTLKRPGLLIGPYGQDIDIIEEMMSQRFNKPVKVKVYESDYWL